jgi:hypothetical protein
MEVAREQAGALREAFHQGRGPQAERDRLRIAAAPPVTFKAAAEEYIASHRAGWKNAKHAQQWQNTLTTGGAWDTSSGKMSTYTKTLYGNQIEAEARLEKLFADPPVLQRFVDRITWRLLPFPTSSGQLDIEIPLVRDFQGEQLLEALSLDSEIKG